MLGIENDANNHLTINTPTTKVNNMNNMNPPCEAKQPTEQPRPEKMMAAIRHIGTINDKLDSILDRARGCNPADPTCEPAQDTNLNYILTTGVEDIYSQIEQAHSRLDELAGVLF